MITTERIAVVVGAVVCVLLQLLVAPHIRLFAAVPNFLVAFSMAVAVVRPAQSGPVLPFVLGLLFDLTGGAPMGAMAFSLTAFSALASWGFMHVDNDSLFMALAVLALSVLCVEVSYAGLVLASGLSGSFGQALLYRVVPCFLYDLVLAFAMYPLLLRFARPNGALRTELTQLR